MNPTRSPSRRRARPLGRVISVLPTPFTPEEDIDEGALRRLVEFAIAARASAICLPAYASEFYKLSDDERGRVVRIAAAQAAGRIPVVAQSNHPSAHVAAEFARRNADLGADVVSIALPRQFPVPEPELVRYCEQVCRAVRLPVLVQDFNPTGASVGADFCRRLLEACPNFVLLKIEEPRIGAKVSEIRRRTRDRVGVISGWGGLYVTELFESGIRGIMPGTGLCDLLDAVWRALEEERRSDAFDTFEKLAPLVTFSLHSMELYHHVEKRLLARRGVLPSTAVRAPGPAPSRGTLRYVDELIDRALAEATRLGLPIRPL
jgi:4-hydroxy-tetrahydrodipicolinate synthase